jgi:NADP-dependent 3-hydroxy acid dehydrogenase YdfG
LHLVREGARVAVTGRDTSRFDEVRSQLGDDALILAADIRSISDMETVTHRISEAFGGLDIFFADAALGD